MALPEIPGFRILRELGAGGMATVYLAEQEDPERKVALKIMTPGLSVDEIACHRFVKEGKFATEFDHPNLLTVYDTGIHEVEEEEGGDWKPGDPVDGKKREYYWMCCEYLPGGTVRDRLGEGIEEADALRIVAEAAAGLGYAHSKGIIHRDLKPGNLLFNEEGVCVLGDFGIAKAVNSNTASTKIGTSVGTPHYMSPEQAKGEKVDHRSDIYALGVLFYELLTGKPPFDAGDPFTLALMQIQQPVPELPKNLSRYQPIIEKLMEKDREQRYDSTDAFLADLKALTAGKKQKPRKEKKARAEKPRPGKKAPAARTVKPKPKKEKRPARRSGGLRPVTWAAILLVVTLAGVMLVKVGWPQFQAWLAERPASTATTLPSAEPEPAATEDATDEIEQWLARADAFRESKRFFAPANANAYETYQRVLRRDVTNARAQEGLQALLDSVIAEARRLWDGGEENEARALVREGLRRFPADPELTAIIDRMGREDSGSDSGDTPIASADLERVLARADRAHQGGNYDEATRLYRQVLTSDPDNATAQRKLSEIANIWSTAAQSYLQQGQLDTAAGMIRKGLQAKPDDPRLQALQERLESMRADAGG